MTLAKAAAQNHGLMDNGPFLQTPPEESRGRWIALAIGAALVMLAVAALAFFGRQDKAAPVPEDPYISNLNISEPKLSASENFVGVSVSYLDGKISNNGSKTLVGATVEAVFRNSLGEIVQKESLPLMLVVPGPAGAYTDLVPLSKTPLLPNQTREFRLTFEHISDDWNHGYPELRFTKLILQ